MTGKFFSPFQMACFFATDVQVYTVRVHVTSTYDVFKLRAVIAMNTSMLGPFASRHFLQS